MSPKQVVRKLMAADRLLAEGKGIGYRPMGAWFNDDRLYQHCGEISPVQLESAHYAQHGGQWRSVDPRTTEGLRTFQGGSDRHDRNLVAGGGPGLPAHRVDQRSNRGLEGLVKQANASPRDSATRELVVPDTLPLRRAQRISIRFTTVQLHG